MWRKHQLIMLSTNEKAKHAEYTMPYKDNKIKFQRGEYFLNSFNLYIISKEEIKEGDWFIFLHLLDIRFYKAEKLTDKLIEGKGYSFHKTSCKKIIATTDKNLKLPEIPISFIEQFIKEYNTGNVIKEVMVKYEERSITINKSFPVSVIQNHNLKLTSDDMIVIHQEKNDFHSNNRDEDASASWGFGGKNKISWNRKEVIDLINKFEKDTFPLRYEGYPTEKEDINMWIKNNL